MKLLMLAVAERAIRDGDTDRMSLVDIIDSVGADSFPHLLDELALLTIYHNSEKGPEDDKVVVTLKNNDEELTSQEQVIHFGDRIGNRTVTRVSGIVLSKPGTFTVEIRHNDIELGSWSIPVALES